MTYQQIQQLRKQADAYRLPSITGSWSPYDKEPGGNREWFKGMLLGYLRGYTSGGHAKGSDSISPGRLYAEDSRQAGTRLSASSWMSGFNASKQDRKNVSKAFMHGLFTGMVPGSQAWRDGVRGILASINR